MEYKFRQIEKKWQQTWKAEGAYKVNNPVAGEAAKPKYYVLDMFPYPSGAGLHVGHPLGYIASDIYSRYKRLKGFNVLHPMGFDSFGLPAEQYALETGQHPADTTEKNIQRYHEQLDNIGFSFDWSREVRTSDPTYYKWTQYIFLQLFDSWFNRQTKKAERIATLIALFEKEGNVNHPAPGNSKTHFSANDWNQLDEKGKLNHLMDYRLAFLAYGDVNWCEALGTVLANDEVVNGVSERGGHPVEKKKLHQWYLRITEYADRLLQGLDTVDFSDAMKDMQRNWIGKSQGAEINFKLDSAQHPEAGVRVYTTRPDTIFGVDFMVLAPEHALVATITTNDQKAAIDEYLAYVKSRSERERMAEVKSITGAFTGAYCENPFDSRKIPIWISEYVLAGYGTGAIMAVPCGDQRDYNFARHFNIPITNIIGEAFNGEEANPTKEAILQQSGFLDGMEMKRAIDVVIDKLEELSIGKRQVNYRMRDAGFSRQRYWGEPFPMVYKEGIPYPLPEDLLPVELPHVDSYKPGPEGEGPLANLKDWVLVNSPVPGEEPGMRETNTMPGYAGSSWYFLRYMDPHNDTAFVDRKIADYWGQVDLYVGGTEHAVGHLLYSRMWTKVLFDLGYIGFDEPFKKLMNQGMIQGSSRIVYRVAGENKFVSAGQKDAYNTNALHVNVDLVDGLVLDIERFRKTRDEFADAVFVLEDGTSDAANDGQDGSTTKSGSSFLCGAETEKMSKSKFNVVNPDDIVERYGADTFRMYEMFLGPIDQSKPWDTKGIEGVHRFLRKFWRLYVDEVKGLIVTNEEATQAELKTLHKTIKKIEEDTERFSFNTAVSGFMIVVNELADLKCHKRSILEPLLILITPYAPHIAEELFQLLQSATTASTDDLEHLRTGSVLDAKYPVLDATYLVENSKEYPVSINGKLRTTLNLSLDLTQQQVEALIVENDIVRKWLEGKAPKKIIYVKNKMINVVL